MIPAFDPRDESTWLKTLTPEQMALVYQRTTLAFKKAVQQDKFHLKPIPDSTPLRWRKVDVLRDLEGGRAMLRRSA